MKKWMKWMLPVIIVASSCKKNDVPQPPVSGAASGVYVLNEGNFNQNNAKLGFYNLETGLYSGDYFMQQNPGQAGLGDVASDMIQYGSKLYIVMNNSNRVTVLNVADATLIDTISFAGKQPRFAIASVGKVFVTAYDGTVNVIDTSSLTIIKSISVGSNPEGIAQSGNKLYVANSGGLNWPVYDSTVSVIDLNTLTEIQKIHVGINPNSIEADNAGNLYVSCIGNYNNIVPKIVKLSTASNAVVQSADTAVGTIRFYNNQLYVTGGFLGSAQVRNLSTANFSVLSPNIITDGTVIQMPYGLNIDAHTGDFYIMDALDFVGAGKVFCFNANGQKKFSFSTTPGNIPSKVLFTR